MSTFGERLKQAIDGWTQPNGKPGSIRAFQREMEERLGDGEGQTGVSYPTVHRYLKDDSAPSIHFLREAADVLGVNERWLLSGEGAPTEGAERGEALRDYFERRRRKDTEFLRSLEPEDQDQRPATRHRRLAVLLFAEKLRQAEFSGAPWTDDDDRRKLLEVAYRFLEGVEEALTNAARQHPSAEEDSVAARLTREDLVVTQSGSKSWELDWLTKALELFSQRVVGLGVRTGGWMDSQYPPVSSVD